jgi:phosphatidylglycerol:prolipoprotein diacylglycerol transferase
MWQELLACMSQRRVALCIPWGGEAIPLIYWYGVLASVGIFVGAFYASRHLKLENEDPDVVWDALLWVLIPGLIGGRLWYVLQAVIAGSNAYSLSRPLDIINPRLGGMNIFGAILFGVIAVLIYARFNKKIKGWLLADAALMGLLLGQGIGRFGNYINEELYGPPTGSSWFGMRVEQIYRLPQFADLPPETRFHPTMIYEAVWLFLCFGVLYFLFRRYQERFIPGMLTGLYLILAGFGRFILEFWRPDQPTFALGGSGLEVSYSRVAALLLVLVGVIILLDRLGHLKIPFIPRPPTFRQRQAAYQAILTERRRQERAREREKLRAQRRKLREATAREETQQEDQ